MSSFSNIISRSFWKWLPAGIALGLPGFLAFGCHHDPPVPVVTTNTAFTGVTLTDVTRAAGIDFRHVNGGNGQKWLPETMGSGLAWIDYDGDGYPDLFLVNSRPWTASEKRPGSTVQTSFSDAAAMPTCKLYHNNGNGTFTDVTAKAGLKIPMYGMGVCVGDYDNDGKPDLYVTGLGRNYLFHNNGNGTFTDVTARAGVLSKGWSTSAAWVDYDRDGHLDLIVCHYVKWAPATDIPFSQNGHRHYGTPGQYSGETPTLYHNSGNGTFTDVTAKAGMLASGDGSRKLQGKSLGVAICDYDADGWPDLVISNDTEPNYLFHNEHNGTFKEVGIETGVAYSDSGTARGAMGIDACDYDHKGRDSLVIGNFSNQMLAVYHNEGGQLFRDVAAQNGIGPPSRESLSFGLFFFDLDNDGNPDLFIANGHVDDDVSETEKMVSYAESPLIYRNMGNGNFQNISTSLGAAIQEKRVARGTGYADYDLDGDLDIALSTNNGPASLFRNDGGNTNHSFRLELEGGAGSGRGVAGGNRSAIGALVTVRAGGLTQTCRVHSGSSYCSQSELPLTIGLGQSTQADSVTITWPSQNGETTSLGAMQAGKIYHVKEFGGVVSQHPFPDHHP